MGTEPTVGATRASGIGLGIGEIPVANPAIISALIARVATTPQPAPTAARRLRDSVLVGWVWVSVMKNPPLSFG